MSAAGRERVVSTQRKLDPDFAAEMRIRTWVNNARHWFCDVLIWAARHRIATAFRGVSIGVSSRLESMMGSLIRRATPEKHREN
jgi:hypothetical protein